MDDKKLLINAAFCDATDVTEEKLAGFSKIQINSAIIFVNDESSTLLARHGVAMNCMRVLNSPAVNEVLLHNGLLTIGPSDPPEPPVALMVNGKLIIEDGAERALSGYTQLIVNGELMYPESMSGVLSKAQVNGKTSVYPDGAVLLKNTFTVDKAFTLRASAKPYYVANKVVMVESGLDIERLVSSGARFVTKKAIVAEQYFERALPLFGDTVEMISVPEGTLFVRGHDEDSVLTAVLVRQSGGKLFIDDDLTLLSRDAELLKDIRFLQVNGHVFLPDSLQDSFLELNARYETLMFYTGTLIHGKASVKIDAMMLRKNGGVTLDGCASVTLEPELTPEDITDHLKLYGCAVVKCSPEQRWAVEMVSQGVASIETDSASDTSTSSEEDEEDPNTVVINAASYKF